MENTLIAYSTKYGGTLECARRIERRLPGTVTLVSLDENPDVPLAPYDCVVLGCSVYMGKPRKAMRRFCERNTQALIEKPRLGLFLCCIQDLDKTVAEQFNLTYPRRMQGVAAVLGQLGGIVDFHKLRPTDKLIMNLIMGDLKKRTGNQVVSTLSDERIERFCTLLMQGKPQDPGPPRV